MVPSSTGSAHQRRLGLGLKKMCCGSHVLVLYRGLPERLALTAWTAQSLHLHPVYPIVAVLCASGRPTLVSFSFSRLLVLHLSAEACLAVFSRSRLFVCALV